MTDDPNSAYTVTPHPDPARAGWYQVSRHGEPWRTCPSREVADRYATDSSWRAELAAKETPLHLRPGFGEK